MRGFAPVGLLAAGVLAACGGGGGGGSSTPPPAPTPPAAQFSITPNPVTFNAAEPKSPKPADIQMTATVTGTVTGTTLYLLVALAGDNVLDELGAPAIIGTNTGGMLLKPVSPMSLGSGTFTGTLTVRACMDSPTCASGELAGSPRTVNLNYVVGSSVQQDTVMPRVVDRTSSGTVVLRGSGLAGVTAVRFGTVPSGTVTVRSPTEVAVQLPPAFGLPAATHAVSLNNGTIPFTGSIVAVDPAAFPKAKISYPDVPVDVPSLVYDAERRALFVAERYADRSASSNILDHRVLRYAFDGVSWGTPTVSPTTPFHVTTRLRDLALSPRGDRLLVLSEADIKEIDPVTLAYIAQGVNIDSFGLEYMRFLAIANDGYALITSDYYGSGGGSVYLYSLPTRTFTKLNHRLGSVLGGTPTVTIGTLGKAVVGASGDGSRALLAAGPQVPAQSSHLDYAAANGQFRLVPALTFMHANDYPPAIDTTGAHIVLGNGNATSVFAGDYSLLCTLPADTRAYTISPAGNRAFALSLSSTLQAYSTVNASGGPCAPDGPSIAVDDPGIDPPPADFFPLSNVQMTISPDGGTLFMAGVNGIVVQPWPPGP
jgi:hypothetical protein